MKIAPLPINEEARLKQLTKYNVLDSLSEEIYDNLTTLASLICETPISAISLIDKDRQWFKSKKGIEETETSRDIAFCAHAILQDDIMEVSDAFEDDRFRDNPLVAGEPGIRFYAGMPLMTHAGLSVGTLCVIDTKPKKLSDKQLEALRALSAQVMQLLEARLSANEAMLETIRHAALISNMTSGLLAVGPDDKIIFANEMFASIFNINETNETLKGRNIEDVMARVENKIIQPSPRLQKNKNFDKRKKVLGEEVQLVENRYIERDFVPVMTETEYAGYIWIFRDVTAGKKQARDLSIAVENANMASQTKSEFLANMSHEIRTPLNGIIGLTDVLLRESLSPSQKELAGNISECGHSLLQIVNDILDYSKIEAKKLDFENVPFSLQDCLRQAILLVQHKADEKGVRVCGSVDINVPTEIFGDPGRVKQVLLNLLMNAVKFTSQGDVRITISGRVLPDAQYEIHFSVRDTGMGIAPDRAAELFKPFIQVDASVSRKFGGTGLGLTISKQLCELMGGRIWLESEIGKGSNFHFTILANSAVGANTGKSDDSIASTDESEQNLKNAFPALKILVADDNVINQKLTLIMLQRLGYEADVVSNGIEVVTAVQSKEYDLILMDVQMPEMSGLEASRRIRHLPELKSQPKIIALTANAMMDDKDRCLKSGMDGYLSKPIRTSQMVAEILRCFSFKTNFTTEAPKASALEDAIRENFGNEVDIFIPIAQEFVDTYEEMYQNLFLAVTSSSFEDINKWAHKLKGTLCYFSSAPLVEYCQKLEDEPSMTKRDRLMTIELLQKGLSNLSREIVQFVNHYQLKRQA